MKLLPWIVGSLVVAGCTLWWLTGERRASPRAAPEPEARTELERGPAAVGERPGPAPESAVAPAREALPPAERGLELRVVDDATELPVAELVVVEGRGDDERSATSGADGRVALALEPGTARFTARLADGAKVRLAERTFRIAEDDSELVLRARIGPRYLIEVVGPPEARAAEYTVHLVERVELPRIGTREQDRVTPRPLEPGDPARVRFPSRPEASDGDALRLVLRDVSGEWSGSCAPPTLVGEPDEVLKVEVSRFGVLVGQLVETGGAPVRRATAHLTPAGEEPWPRIESEWLIERTEEDGRFRFERLAPGDYHLRLAPPYRPMIQRRVHVPAGTEDLGAIECAGGGEEGAVAGVLKSSAGRGGIGAILQLESLDGTGWARSTIAGRPSPLMSLFYGTRASQEAGAETEVAFRLEEVPAGRYRLVVVPWDGRRYEPTELELEAPTEDVVIWREDSLEDTGFGFVVRDAESGETLPEFQARFHTRRWGKEKSFTHRSGEVLGRVAPDGDLSFAIFADGYAPYWGEASVLAGLSGDPRLVTVDLERGWGAELVVRDGRDPRRHHHRSASALSIPAPGELPLEGVRVLADGVEVGVTDGNGRLRVVLPSEPDAITFECPGWTVTPTTTFADGKALLACPSPKVWMVPVEAR